MISSVSIDNGNSCYGAGHDDRITAGLRLKRRPLGKAGAKRKGGWEMMVSRGRLYGVRNVLLAALLALALLQVLGSCGDGEIEDYLRGGPRVGLVR